MQQLDDEVESDTEEVTQPEDQPAPNVALPDAQADTQEVLTVKQFFRNFNVKKGVDLMVECWRFINVATVIHGWRKALPGVDILQAAVVGARGSGTVADERLAVEESLASVLDAARAVRLGGYDQVTADDIQELVGMEVMVEPTVEQLMEEEEEDERREEQEQNVDPTNQQLSSLLAMAEVFKEALNEYDRLDHRRENSIQLLQNSVAVYSQLYQTRLDARQQALITKYYQPRAASPPPASPGAEEDSPPASPGAEEDEPLFHSDEEPEFLGHNFEGFVLQDPQPQ